MQFEEALKAYIQYFSQNRYFILVAHLGFCFLIR